MSELLSREEEQAMRAAFSGPYNLETVKGDLRAKGQKLLRNLDAIRAALHMPEASVEEMVEQISEIQGVSESRLNGLEASNAACHRRGDEITQLRQQRDELAAALGTFSLLAQRIDTQRGIIFHLTNNSDVMTACEVIAEYLNTAADSAYDPAAILREHDERVSLRCGADERTARVVHAKPALTVSREGGNNLW